MCVCVGGGCGCVCVEGMCGWDVGVCVGCVWRCGGVVGVRVKILFKIIMIKIPYLHVNARRS